MTELEGQQQQKQTQIDKQEGKIRELEDNAEYLQQCNNMLVERVDDLRNKLYDFEVQQFSGIAEA